MSYEGEPSDVEISARREPLETSAALRIGLIVFALSRLDLTVDRYVDKVAVMAAEPAWQRLAHFAQGLDDPELRAGFGEWIADTRTLEPLRSALAAGKWVPDRRRDCIVCELAGERHEYRVADFDAWLARLKEMQAELQRLCATERGLYLQAA